MSFELPANIEQDIRHYADERHISADEAVIDLIRAGLLSVDAPSSDDGVIGFLKDSPKTAEAIRDLAKERRLNAYG